MTTPHYFDLSSYHFEVLLGSFQIASQRVDLRFAVFILTRILRIILIAQGNNLSSYLKW